MILKSLLDSNKTYSAILADPPWQYDSPAAIFANIKKDGSIGKSVNLNNHYNMMSQEELMSLPIPASKDCLLFLWVTNPFLCDGSGAEVVKAWGFTPKTVITWAKVQADGRTPSMRNGHWFRSASEHIIFAVKGKVKRPTGYPCLPTWQPHKRLGHSVKPDLFYDYVEAACPNGPWLEMFCRRERKNWDCWGNEVEPAKSDLTDLLE